MSRDHILHKVRTALGRSAGQAVEAPPTPWIKIPEVSMDARLEQFCKALEALNGKTLVAGSKEEARQYAGTLLQNRTAIASNAPFLAACGIHTIPGVLTGIIDRVALRDACAGCDVGITSADYALADTGTLVLLSSPEEARMISLLPPVHLAVVPRDRLLTGLDELLTVLPVPSQRSSSMVFITGPSRTADIEQILVRGVHGPGETHVVWV
ncbi:MAG: lactate utilization protein [Acidobacteriia bacterium]|nr:lactate utilization protein [Terriglobia bacterium]